MLFFQKTRDTYDFSSIELTALCPFKMHWRIAQNNQESFAYKLTDINPFNFHQRITDYQIQNESKLQRIPLEMQDKAIELFWQKLSVNEMFTAGILITSRVEGMHAKLKGIMKTIKRNSDIKIFTAFESIASREDEKIMLKEYEQTKNTTFTINTMEAIGKLYSNHCLKHYQNSINGIKATFLEDNRDDDQRWKVLNKIPKLSKEEYIIKKSLKYTCRKYEKYKILYNHLLFIYKITGRNIIELIIENTARRWLLPSVSDETNNELFKRIQGVTYYRKLNASPVNQEERKRY
ncbi:unnamed protein product [Blepharisma stoltei]|uniref:Uncharacterized protein n=1 Tax=Blepharisma stoltei TaxID=1481888 RepID=A0AAU9IUS3_9CILI|nr:unnamed protein product [Blepharisma stoltei]